VLILELQEFGLGLCHIQERFHAFHLHAKHPADAVHVVCLHQGLCVVSVLFYGRLDKTACFRVKSCLSAAPLPVELAGYAPWSAASMFWLVDVCKLCWSL
jgi:hypothetical protein